MLYADYVHSYYLLLLLLFITLIMIIIIMEVTKNSLNRGNVSQDADFTTLELLNTFKVV